MLFALWRGFIRELISLAGLIAAFLLASQFSPVAAGYLNSWLSDPDIADLAGFGLVFVAVLFLSGLIGLLLQKLLPAAFTVMDRILGLLFGAARGILYISLFFLIFSTYADTERPWVERSLLAPYVMELSNLIGEAIPAGYPLSRKNSTNLPTSGGRNQGFFDGGQPVMPDNNTDGFI